MTEFVIQSKRKTESRKNSAMYNNESFKINSPSYVDQNGNPIQFNHSNSSPKSRYPRIQDDVVRMSIDFEGFDSPVDNVATGNTTAPSPKKHLKTKSPSSSPQSLDYNSNKVSKQPSVGIPSKCVDFNTCSKNSSHDKKARFSPFAYVPENVIKTLSRLPRDAQSLESDENGNDLELEEDYFPDVNSLVENCESYMNWIHNQCEENFLRFVQTLESKYILPSEKFDREETIKWFNFEHVAKLGAICYFFIELNKFPEARVYVIKAREFISVCSQKGTLAPEYVASFDYVWDYLCLYGSIKEWQFTGVMDLFPEMNLLSLTLNFNGLNSSVRAGVFCVKAYFLELQKTQVDVQIDALRQAITCEPQYFEWFLCLQEALRYQRVKLQDCHHVYPWDAEIQAICTAGQLSPDNPRCLIAGIHLLAEITKSQLAEPRWTVIRFGDINFHGLLDVKNFMKEQGEIVMKIAPKSVRINTTLSQIYTCILPYGHRDYRLARECLERCLKAHPDSCKANHRMADYYLNVDTNYRRAEMYYELALTANEKNFISLTAMIQIMIRNAEHRRDEIFTLIDTQLKAPFWDSKQLGTLNFFKGLAYMATLRTREATKAFMAALVSNEKSLAFQDLPSLHRRYGWPGWPSTSRLNFENIRGELLKEKLKSDCTRKKMINEILRLVNEADSNDKRFRASKQNWRR
ncbi:unnamed protein product [Allacma fusca]|uniref:Tetratricopeptide repeat protein n=1 Tax=Allacma fusca TaxID=39272 RepID=A0A8J2KAI8_9HEXA|nr:unnamed protein product [Allacma fusca]